MDLSNINKINKIKIYLINNGLWTINQYEFYVEIAIINNSGDGGEYFRKINQNELVSIQTQINVSHLDNKTYKTFTYQYNEMQKYQKIVKYLNSQGINKFKSIKRKKFSSFEKKFGNFNLAPIYKHSKDMTFFSNYIKYPAFRIIGEILLTKESPFYDLIPYIRCILGRIIPRETFDKKVKTFLESLDTDVLFDACKVGYQFCVHFSDPSNIKFSEQITETDVYYKSKIEENSDFVSRLDDSFDNYNLLLFKVIRPSHCYHCIISISRIIRLTQEHDASFCLNEKTLIFCQNGGNFAERLNEIAKTSVKDSKSQDTNLTYFIIHPELLNEEDHSFLVEFLNARLNAITDKKLPRVVLISSLDYKTFCVNHVEKFKDIEFQIDKNLIYYLCKLSYPEGQVIPSLRKKEGFTYQLYYSDKAGSGKTYQIFKDYKEKNECSNVIGEDILKSIFVDVNTKKLNEIKYYDKGESKEYQYLHLDLSPELFDNNYQFFDDLWMICVLRYQIDSKGTSINTPNNIFFEVPTLTKKQYTDGGFIDEADFPICVDVYHKISAQNTKEDDDDDDDAKDDPNIKIPEIVKPFCDAVFKTKIKYTFELLSIICHMFYPGIKFDSSNFVPRILEEINIFMEEFCQNLKPDDEKSKAIFLLLLRSNFHVWNMESLFGKTEQPKSFIIMSNQNLFCTPKESKDEKDKKGKKDDENKGIEYKKKWILLCFSSEGETNTWDTSCLKFNINKVDESKLLQNKFFSKLTGDPNIKIYSNQTNYMNDQTYFFGIIKTFLYINTNIGSKYRKITDGVICNNFINFYSVDKLRPYLQFIKEGKDKYEQVNKEIKWNSVFDFLKSVLVDYNKSLFDTITNLAEDETVKQISSITLTMTLVKRFVTMIIRVVLKQPLIFEGFTGVGKTWSVKLLKTLIEIAEGNDDFRWKYHQVDCHGALQLKELLNIRKEKFENDSGININHIFFFDELNTSPVSNYVINEMNNYYLKKKHKIGENNERKFDNSSIIFIAAINPYIKVDKFSRNLPRVGIKQIIPSKISKLRLCNTTPLDNKNLYEVKDLNKLAYNVRELSDSTKMITIKSDPELFFFNKDDLKERSSIYLPPDEIKTIGHIVDHYLNKLIKLSNFQMEESIHENEKRAVIEDDDKRERNLQIIENTLISNKNEIAKILVSSLSLAFLETRELMQLKSILSFRDVKRLMQFFLLFFQKLIKVYFKQDGQPDITNSILVDKIIPQSIVLALMISIVFRFSNETKIETLDGKISLSSDEEEKILSRCTKFGLKLDFSYDRTYYKVGIRTVLLEKLQKIQWGENLINPNDWNQIVISYAWMKCMKYIYKDDNNNSINSSLFKLNSLMVHLFAISSCYSACKNSKDSVIPCMIIGMPGTSKTLAIQLFADYKQLFSKNKKNFFSTTYLSTRVSEAEGLNAHYRDCAMFMMNDKNHFAVCVIDELGLANLNETRPLKLLHYYFDKGTMMVTDKKSTTVPVMSIAASNYALDFANMNRGILICTDLPTDTEIAEAFYFSELESKEIIVIDRKAIDEYEKRYFNDVDDFFNWKKDEKIHKFKNFLQILWELTKTKERPDMLTLRPLYLLFNTIFHNREYNISDEELIDSLCLYLISAISCSPSESYDKLKLLITKLDESLNKKGKSEDKEQNNDKTESKGKGKGKGKRKRKGKAKGKRKGKAKGKNKDKDDDRDEDAEKEDDEDAEKEDKNDNKDENAEKEDENRDFNKLVKIVLNQKQDVINAIREIFEGFTSSIYYKMFVDEIKKQSSKNGCLPAYRTIQEAIEEKNRKNLSKILTTKDEKNYLYTSFKELVNVDFFKELTKEINDPKYDNYKILRQSVISILKGKSKRALCFRTKNYECLDFIEDLLDKTTRHYLNGMRCDIEDCTFNHVYPTNFKLSKQDSADTAIQDLIDIISDKSNKQNVLHYFLIIGNVCLTDALLDLLNTPNEGKADVKTKKPLISRNGFSVELNEFPKNIVFCFIMNEKDFNNRNSADSFPIPLLDRLNQLYFDYDQRDEFGIIEKYQKFNQEKAKLSTPFSSIIHEYFNRFVTNLKQVTVPKNTNAAVFTTFGLFPNYNFKGIDPHHHFINGVSYQDIDIQLDELDDEFIDWDTKILLLRFCRNNSSEMLERCQKNFEFLKNNKNHKIVFYWSYEINELYEAHLKEGAFKMPLPLPENYENLENDGSINKLISRIKKEEEEAKKQKNKVDDDDDDDDDVEEDEPIRGIILTTSPMMETIKFEEGSQDLLKSNNTLFLFDQYITSADNFDKRIDDAKNARKGELKNVVIQLNHFQIEHDRYIRYLFEDTKSVNTFIIYHLKNSIIPEGLYTSKKWPVYWIESISDSTLAEFKTTDIVNCIRFKHFYKEKIDDLYFRIFHQIYYEISDRYSMSINEEKVKEMLKLIIGILKTKCPENKSDSYINSVNFGELIDKFEGKTIEDSFKNLDFKREFLNIIIKHIPILDHLMKVLVLNYDVIEKSDINYTFLFIRKILVELDIEKLAQIADIDNQNYQQLNNEGIYFPELIFPQVLAAYNVFNNKSEDYVPFDKSILEKFCFLQTKNKETGLDEYLKRYFNNYFMTYLNNNGINMQKKEEQEEFRQKLLELAK